MGKKLSGNIICGRVSKNTLNGALYADQLPNCISEPSSALVFDYASKPWVYGVHSRPSAAQDIGLLAVKGEGVQAAD